MICACLVLAMLGLLLFSALGDRKLEALISRLRDRHSVRQWYSPIDRLWRPRPLDIRPCCAATRDMNLSKFMERSSQCEEPILVGEGVDCGCEEVIACKMVVVTAFSENHFEEAKDFLASMQTHMPLTPILVYDLGISAPKRSYLNSYCNIKVMDFDHQKYPTFVEDLDKFSWKPLIVNEVVSLEQYEVVMWCDASCRLHQSLYPLLPRLSKYPIIPGPTTPLPFVATAHDGMLQYLHIQQNRSTLASLGRSLQANAIIMWACQDIRQKFLRHWVDCALHEECISPAGAHKDGCSTFHPSQEAYVGCHRYDQTAYNAILIREYGMDFMRQVKERDKDIQKFLTIFRGISHFYQLVEQCPL